ncbi:Putative Zinc finger C2H2-type [Colletotrichum destructivum]|uniref:Zinc finger C2H2-type n=1 Tax=Colletotrichum destructivum TaxID=34406 RepID=A0AAX4IHL4_9PEZI|nr:Putative Zinc finger C2H2-type [Colletotrichum destructivum]
MCASSNTQMSTWACPGCSTPCDDAKALVEHLALSHFAEVKATNTSFPKKRKRQPSEIDGEVACRRPRGEIDYVCPYPHCGQKTQYSTKSNLLRHFSTHYTDFDGAEIQCPRCLKLKHNLGALSAHWEKSCRRRFSNSRFTTRGRNRTESTFLRKKKPL